MKNTDSAKAKEIYAKGQNIMEYFRTEENLNHNSQYAIEVAYDLQSGSYAQKRLKPTPENQESYQKNELYTQSIAKLFDALTPYSILNTGVGESTTLSRIVAHMKNKPCQVLGLDISWSRIAYGKAFAAKHDQEQDLFVANMLSIPLITDSVDIVFSSHALEPNRGREKEIIQEMARVASRYVILLEPAYELGSKETKKHIDQHKYVTGLKTAAEELGLSVLEHKLFDVSINPNNQTALTIIQVGSNTPIQKSKYACPKCKKELSEVKGQLFCSHDHTIYPVMDDIPCLKVDHAIIASKFTQEINL